MPNAEIAARGGAVRWRTITTPDGRKVKIAVVRKPGPRGGKTVGEFDGPADGVHTTAKRKRKRS